MNSKKIIVTGITGQDGSYMAEYLLNLGHTVYGMVRRTSQINDKNFRHLRDNPNLIIVRGDLSDGSSINTLVNEIQPEYFINFAAQSFVGDSWKIPEETFMACAVGVLKCLEAIRNYAPSCRFYNAGSSEQFGDVICTPQNESHPFRPRSPYGAAKASAHHLVKVYRESYELYAVQGLLFNHESERRGEEFVTRKITKGFARIVKAIQNGHEFEPIRLGNVDSKRDWSHAADFMDAVWRILNQEKYNPELLKKLSGCPTYLTAEDRTGAERHLSIATDIKALSKHIKEYIAASGKEYTIREFIKIITNTLDYDTAWVGQGNSEKLKLNDSFSSRFGLKSKDLVIIDQTFYRPADVNSLCGDSSAIRKELGWSPQISFEEMVKRMLGNDLKEIGVTHL